MLQICAFKFINSFPHQAHITDFTLFYIQNHLVHDCFCCSMAKVVGFETTILLPWQPCNGYMTQINTLITLLHANNAYPLTKSRFSVYVILCLKTWSIRKQGGVYEIFCLPKRTKIESKPELSIADIKYIYIYIYIYTTFTPHFKGKRRCISGIIALLAVLRNAVTRIGGSIYKLYPS